MSDGTASILLSGAEWGGGGGIARVWPNQKHGNSFSLPPFMGEIIGILLGSVGKLGLLVLRMVKIFSRIPSLPFLSFFYL